MVMESKQKKKHNTIIQLGCVDRTEEFEIKIIDFKNKQKKCRNDQICSL